MLKNMIPRKRKTIIRFELVFDDGHNSGFGFPCDEDGNLENLHECAKKNLEWCKAHPEEFVRYNEVVAFRQSYTEPARGTCVCGATVILEDQYYGACQCPNCERWYNLFGQSLLPPDQWHNDPSEEDYWEE